MTVAKRKRTGPTTDDQDFGRSMVDAIRAMMGLGPLYAADRITPSFRIYDMPNGNALGDGNRRARVSRV